MEKKYELIKDEYGLTRIRALKDFVLITGEQIKKGDIGGLVESEDCLSQEGNCWAMECTDIEGKVSGNAVIKDEACIYGTVSGNAIVTDTAIVHGTVSGNAVVKDVAEIYGIASGNALVKDFAFIDEYATITGNAVVQAYQHIKHGTVTTNLLRTKDWEGALYAELGVVPENGKVILYKKVWSTDNPDIFKSWYKHSFIYEIGKDVVENDADEDVMKECGKGLHFTTLEFIYKWEGDTILECEVDVDDIVTVQGSKVRTRKCRVVGIYKEE